MGIGKKCGAPVGFRFGGQLLALGISPSGIDLFLLLVLGAFKLSPELALTSRLAIGSSSRAEIVSSFSMPQ